MIPEKLPSHIHRIFILSFILYCCFEWNLGFSLSQCVLVIPYLYNYYYWTPWLIKKNKAYHWIIWISLLLVLHVALYATLCFGFWYFFKMGEDAPINGIIASGINGAFVFITMSTGSRLAKEWLKNQKTNHELVLQKSLTELQIMKSNINLPFILKVLDQIEKEAQEMPRDIEETIIYLSNLLRHSLYESKAQHIPLERELKVLSECIGLINKVYSPSRIDLCAGNTLAGQQIPPNLLIRLLGIWGEHLRSIHITESVIAIEGDRNCLVMSLPCSHYSPIKESVFEQCCPPYTDLCYSVKYEWTPTHLKVKIINLSL